MNYQNYRVNKEGIYQSSKTEQEGYEKVIYGANADQITYQKKIPRLEGIITGIDIKDIQTKEGHTVKMFEVIIVSGDTKHQISMPLLNQGSTNYTEYVPAFLSALNGYKPGELASVGAYTKKSTGTAKDGTQKEYKNFTVAINHINIKVDGDKPEWTGFIPFSDIPRATSKVVAGVTKWIFDDVMEFWWTKYQEIKAKLEAHTPSSQPAPTPAFAAVVLDDNDDLPF